MKAIKLYFVLIIIISGSLISCAQNSKEETSESKSNGSVIHLISPEMLNEKIGKITLIDIRTPQEFAEGHLKSSVNINFYDPDFMDKMNQFDKNEGLYIYCRSGNRSSSAAKKLEKIGFVEIYDLEGGIIHWRKKNMEVIK